MNDELSMVVLRKDPEVEERPVMFCLFMSPLSKIMDTDNSQYVCSREILETSLQWMVRARRRWHGLWQIQVVGHDRTGEVVYESQPQTHLFQWISSHGDHGVIHGELGQVVAQPLVSDAQDELDEENLQEWIGMLVARLDVTVFMLVDKAQQLGDLMVLNLVTSRSMIACQSESSIQTLKFLSELPGTTFFQVIGRREVFVPFQEYSSHDFQKFIDFVKNLSSEDAKAFLMTKGTVETQLTFPDTLYMERISQPNDITNSRLFIHHQRSLGQIAYADHYDNLISTLKDIAATGIKYASNIKQPSSHRNIRVCMWSNSAMDGQRTIWLQLMRSLDPKRVKYSFSMLITHTPFSLSPLHHLLHNASETSNVFFSDDIIRTNHLLSKPATVSILPALHDIQRTLDPSLQVGRSPLDIYPFSASDFQQQPTYPDTEGFLGSIGDFASFTNRNNINMEMLTEYAHRRFVAAKGVVSGIEPSWVRRLFGMLVRALRRPNDYPIDLNSADPLHVSRRDEVEVETIDGGASCDILLLSNGKGLTTDVLITDAARSIGLPVLLELPNLFMHPSLTTSVVVAPSHYALRHPSMRATLQSQLELEQIEKVQGEVAMVRGSIAADYDVSMKPRPVSVVIAPSVDTEHFRSQRHHNKMQNEEREVWENYHHDHVDDKEVKREDDGDGIVRIGFIGRLVEAKSPGLFLLVAKVLYEHMPQVRFVIVGSGQLLSYLKELSVRLQLEGVVQWVPWVQYNDLPQVLDQLDIVFNPSLVDSFETFCIANIECMSMGIPLVTFAVGGIGEYFSDEPFSRLEQVEDKKQQMAGVNGSRMLEVVVDGRYGKRLLLIDDTEAEKEKITKYSAQPSVHGAKEEALIHNAMDGDGADNRRWTVTRTGVLLHAATPTDIAEALQYLAERPLLRSVLGGAARTVVETRFALKRQMSQYDQLFDSVHSVYSDAKRCSFV